MGRLLFGPQKWREAPGEVRGLLKLTGLKAGRVLDSACGTGRHSLGFARKGFEVTGFDVSAPYLREARQRAQAARLKVRFERADYRDLKRYAGRYDLVLNLFTSFGYEATAAANARVLRHLTACLKRGGFLALELLPRDTLEAWARPQDLRQLKDGTQLLEERRWLGQGRLATDATWYRGGRAVLRQSVLHTYTRRDLAALFKRAGLSGIKAYGGYDGRPFKGDSRLLMIGRKA